MKVLKILNTRPAHQAETLNQLILEHGGIPLSLPTLNIVPIDIKIFNLKNEKPSSRSLTTGSRKNKKLLDPAVKPRDSEATRGDEIRSWNNSLNDFDIAIFVSANAVLYGLKEILNIPTIAVGPGTAKALKKKGVSNIILPKQYNSEGILCLPELQHIQNKKIAIVCGENPRTLLNETLKKRNAHVSLLECYRRECPCLNDASKQIFLENKIDIIISTSKESLKNLYEIFANDNRQKLLETPILVISPGMQILAEKLGWKHIIQAPNATNEAIVETINIPLIHVK